MKVSIWHNCYDLQWGKLLVPEAFSHPAKFAPGLIQRIYRYGLAQGYWCTGDLIGDPFGGIAGGGIMAAYNKLAWIGCELEPRFVDLGNQNIAMHRATWEAHGFPVPVLVQGDSRRFSEVVRAAGIVTSPPLVDCGMDYNTTAGVKVNKNTQCVRKNRPKSIGKGQTATTLNYGTHPGQIGALKAGDLAAICTSPPWENQEPSHQGSEHLESVKNRSFVGSEYGAAQGQIGNDTGESYWQAMRAVYVECHKALKPGGYMGIVIKSYVKNKRKVHLPMHTLKLLIHLGFEPVERVKAMLIKKAKIQKNLFGENIDLKKERKSFFRRLAEEKGSPSINWEEVLFVKKPF